MAAFSLVSLVLRGVAVRKDSVNVNCFVRAIRRLRYPGRSHSPCDTRRKAICRNPLGILQYQPERILDVDGVD